MLGQGLQGFDACGKQVAVRPIRFKYHPRVHHGQAPRSEGLQQGHSGHYRVLYGRPAELLGVDKAVDKVDHQQAATLTDACRVAKALALVNLFGVHVTMWVNQV